METTETAGSIPAGQSDAMQTLRIGARFSAQVTISARTPTGRSGMNIRTIVKTTIDTLAAAAVELFVVACIGVGCLLVTPSA
jgi:hypothetical protein